MLNKKLEKYKQKRDFKVTPEPNERKTYPKNSSQNFVVQKHDASHLHYDFRLELEGVLKSWAIPKGPSLNPHHKRLAMETEDHPLEYQNFEGVIPEGHYGAGTVLIWDKGTYELISKDTSLNEEYKKGHLKIILKGKKLKGGFTLQRIRKGEKPQWLLIKLKDKEADMACDITKENKSVMSGKTLKEINEDAHHE